MKNFLGTVKKATITMGSEPYDYRKTHESLLEATRKTVEHHERMKLHAKIAEVVNSLGVGPTESKKIIDDLAKTFAKSHEENLETNKILRMAQLIINTEKDNQKKTQQMMKVGG